MSVLVTCPRCRVSGRLPDDSPGGTLGCPRCGTEFDIPTHPESVLDVAPAERTEAPGAVVDLGVWVGPAAPLEQTPPPRTLAAAPPRHAIARASASAPDLAPESAATLDWLREEVERFNVFVAAQFAHIRRGREEVARSAAVAESAAITREQSLNQRTAALAGRAAELDRRAAELARRVAEFERRAAEVERQEAALRRRLDEADEVEDEIRGHFETLERDLVSRRRTADGEAVFRRTAG